MPRANAPPIDPALLAPGDAHSREMDLAAYRFHTIRSIRDPLFEMAYARLWEEFGAKHEIESADVLARRLEWDPARPDAPAGRFAMLYELVVVTHDGAFAAARDHTAIVERQSPDAGAVVHLSHVLVDPAHRRGGLAGWLRAWPIATARRCLRACGAGVDAPVSLVGEMEYAAAGDAIRWIRLKAYEKAGFRQIDPAAVHYLQPDFRPPETIDASGGPQPLPMSLIVRRVGREDEVTLTGRELRQIVEALYAMYAVEFRRQDMSALLEQLEEYPPDDAIIALIRPTA